MKIHLGTDHAGFELKESLKRFLTEHGHEVVDHGAHELDSDDDYPDFISPVAIAISEAAQSGARDVRGIVLGGSGQGEALAANRFPRVRAALYYGGNEDIITLSREHNNANVLSLGARFVSEDEAQRVVKAWLTTDFTDEERHERRLKKLEIDAQDFWRRLNSPNND